MQIIDNKIYGIVGGQLEYVSQRLAYNIETQTFQMIIRFTDHDVHWGEHKELVDGKFYEFTFPISDSVEVIRTGKK